MKPGGKTKTPRRPSKHAELHGVPSAAMAKLSVKSEQAAVISDTEAELVGPKPSKESKPRSWHGSDENLAQKPSKTKPSKKEKKGDRLFKF